MSGAPKVLGITGGLLLLAFILLGGRTYTRLRKHNLWWDDYTLAAAFVLALLEWSLFLASSRYGVGRHNYYISHDDQIKAQHLLYASTLPWCLSMMFIKISIACMLLRIRHTKPWLIFLWTMIAVQIASALASLIFQLLECIPLAAVWDPEKHPDATCAKPQAIFASIYVNSAIAITSDLIFAAVPLIFIRKMQRPLREKIVLGCLMGMGLFAATASIVKTTLIPTYGITGDALWDAMDLTLWSHLEEHVGILAACIPCLRSLFERFLHQIGVLSHLSSTTKYSNQQRRHYSSELTATRKSHQLAKMHATANGKSGVGVGISGGKSDANSEVTLWPDEDDKRDAVSNSPFDPNSIVRTTELRVSTEDVPRVDMEMEPSGDRLRSEDRSWHDGHTVRAKGEWTAV